MQEIWQTFCIAAGLALLAWMSWNSGFSAAESRSRDVRKKLTNSLIAAFDLGRGGLKPGVDDLSMWWSAIQASIKVDFPD